MRKLLIYISNHHEAILRLIIVSLSVLVITALLPHRIQYKFEFHRGSAWINEDLYAPFTFAVNKPKDMLESERKEAAKNAPLYFKVDTMVRVNALALFNEEITKEKDAKLLAPADTFSITKDELFYSRAADTGTKLLNTVYDRGIVETANKNGLDQYTKIKIVKNKTSHDAYVTDVFTLATAIAFADESLNSCTPDEKQLLSKYLKAAFRPDLIFDENLNEVFRKQAFDNVSITRGVVSKNDLIISKGEIISDEKLTELESLRQAVEEDKEGIVAEWPVLLGQLAIVSIAISMLMIFLATLRKDIFADNRKIALIFFLIILTVVFYTQALRINYISLYLVPCCVLPIIIRVFFDTRLALFTHVLTILVLGSVAPNGFEFVFMQIIAGMVTIFSFAHLRKRAQLFVSVSFIFISYLVCYICLSAIHEGSFDGLSIFDIGWMAGNVMLTLFSYPLIYIFEKLFGLTSDVSLMEMADMNSALLRDLSVKAPGTFQHSMQVANLAEAGIYAIGGNALLVRVGALYHDIGKMDMPLYFIENQISNMNPHDDLSFEESASIIISHVIKGIEKARKNNLPDLIIDFIRTHHGTTMVQYFYQSYLKNYPDKIAHEEDFRYPGPLPFSRETAVLMMADSVEASSRSLVNHDAETINKLVDTIIESQIKQQQFINCDITFKDISAVKKVFKKMLMSIYHVRVEYPH